MKESASIVYVRSGMRSATWSKQGCQWRMLPRNFAKWQLVYYYHKKWSFWECYDLLLSKLREKARMKMGQDSEASLGIMDSQSVRWGNNRALNGYDGNKKVKGIKQHTVVDKNGFLLAVMVTAAHVHDSKTALLLMRVLKDLFFGIKDSSCRWWLPGRTGKSNQEKVWLLIEVVMRSDDKKPGFKPTRKRWVIERTFSWFDNDRRLCRNYELLMETSEEMVKLSAIKLLLNKFYFLCFFYHLKIIGLLYFLYW